MNQRLKKLVDIALVAASHSDHKHKLGAVIFNKNEVISIGFNKLKTHPLAKFHNKSEHRIFLCAEKTAIIKAGRTDLSGASILVVRKSNTRISLDSAPCPGCMNALIKDTEVKNLYYFENNELIKYKIHR